MPTLHESRVHYLYQSELSIDIKETNAAGFKGIQESLSLPQLSVFIEVYNSSVRNRFSDLPYSILTCIVCKTPSKFSIYFVVSLNLYIPYRNNKSRNRNITDSFYFSKFDEAACSLRLLKKREVSLNTRSNIISNEIFLLFCDGI